MDSPFIVGLLIMAAMVIGVVLLLSDARKVLLLGVAVVIVTLAVVFTGFAG